jgi:hypothetical protein
MKQGFAFQFAPPSGWDDFREADRFVFHGPGEQELIVSGTVVSGRGRAASYQQIKKKLVANAIEAMRRAVDHPDLIVTKDVRESLTANSLRCWKLEAETTDRNVLFLQGVLEAEAGVLLVTLEAPRDEGSRNIFTDFLNGVRPATAEAGQLA